MKKGLPTTIEITDYHVKLFQSKVIKGKKILTVCNISRLLHQTDESLNKSLNEVIVLKNVQISDLTLVIPRRQIILKHMLLPSHQEAELSKMIDLQLVNQIPYALEDVVYEYQVIAKEPTGYTSVSVSVLHKETANRYINILSKMGVNVNRLTISSLGLLGWLFYQDKAKAVDASESLVVVNIDSVHSEVVFSYDRKLVFSRSLNESVKDLSGGNTIGLINQIELSVGNYRKEKMGPDIKKILILSPLKEVQLLREKIEAELKIPTEIHAPFENTLCQKSINLSTLKDQSGLSLSVGFGLQLSDGLKLINLMPKEIHASQRLEQKRGQLVKFALLFSLAFILGVSVLGIDLYQKTLLVNEIEEELQKIKPKIKKAEDRIKFVNLFKDKSTERIFIPDLMLEIFDITDPEISFRSIGLNDKGKLTIQGYGETSASVNTFQSNLIQSSTFSNINLQFATKRRISGFDVTDFKITSQLSNIPGESN